VVRKVVVAHNMAATVLLIKAIAVHVIIVNHANIVNRVNNVINPANLMLNKTFTPD
jgi:hypothetical protein